MYAIVKTGGKQYRVKKGDEFHVEKLDVPEGESIELTEVLAVNNDEDLIIGTPVLEDAAVIAEILEQGLEDTIIVFKYKPKKGYRKRREHRQPYTKLRIKDIVLNGDVITENEVLEVEKTEEEAPAAEVEEAQESVEAPVGEVEAVEASEETETPATEENVEIDETITVEDVVDDEGEVVAEIVTDEVTVEVDDQD